MTVRVETESLGAEVAGRRFHVGEDADVRRIGKEDIARDVVFGPDVGETVFRRRHLGEGVVGVGDAEVASELGTDEARKRSVADSRTSKGELKGHQPSQYHRPFSSSICQVSADLSSLLSFNQTTKMSCEPDAAEDGYGVELPLARYF